MKLRCEDIDYLLVHTGKTISWSLVKKDSNSLSIAWRMLTAIRHFCPAGDRHHETAICFLVAAHPTNIPFPSKTADSPWLSVKKYCLQLQICRYFENGSFYNEGGDLGSTIDWHMQNQEMNCEFLSLSSIAQACLLTKSMVGPLYAWLHRSFLWDSSTVFIWGNCMSLCYCLISHYVHVQIIIHFLLVGFRVWLFRFGVLMINTVAFRM